MRSGDARASTSPRGSTSPTRERLPLSRHAAHVKFPSAANPWPSWAHVATWSLTPHPPRHS
eukprot:2176185-Prymnesium_polylepis.1